MDSLLEHWVIRQELFHQPGIPHSLAVFLEDILRILAKPLTIIARLERKKFLDKTAWATVVYRQHGLILNAIFGSGALSGAAK